MNDSVTAESRAAALAILREQFGQAIAATKCHGCGRLLHTVEALEKSVLAIPELGSILDDARRVVIPKKYDCLGCDVCFPAVAANALAEAFPGAMRVVDCARPRRQPNARAGLRCPVIIRWFGTPRRWRLAR